MPTQTLDATAAGLVPRTPPSATGSGLGGAAVAARVARAQHFFATYKGTGPDGAPRITPALGGAVLDAAAAGAVVSALGAQWCDLVGDAPRPPALLAPERARAAACARERSRTPHAWRAAAGAGAGGTVEGVWLPERSSRDYASSQAADASALLRRRQRGPPGWTGARGIFA